MVLKRIYFALGRLYPARMQPSLQRTLIHSGIDEEVELWVGRAITLTILISLLFSMLPVVFIRQLTFLNAGFLPLNQLIIRFSVPVFVFTAAIMAILYYIYLFYRVQERTYAIEKVLPDFLLIVVSNLHAGMSPYAAFVGAARPEFGPLEEEIKKVAAKTSSSQSITIALAELSSRINSSIFHKMIIFFEKAVRSGGQIANILHSSADEIRKVQEMRAELVSQTRSYTIFLGFILVIIAPFLLAVSNNFLMMFLKIEEQTVGGASSFELPIFQGTVDITPAFVETTSIIFLSFASLLVSLFMGSIMRGKPLYGIKYFPVLAVLALAVYVFAKGLVGDLILSFG